MALDLSKVKVREALPSQREPHWQRIRPGCFLGYRPSAREGVGTWIARAYDEEQRGYLLKAIGDFGTLPGRDRFCDAKREAEAFAALVEAGGYAEEKIETVEEACRQYVESHPDSQGRFTRHIYSDPIAKVKLAKLRRHHLKAWRRRLENKPALVTRRKKGPQVTRDRAPSSINRDMAILRAALNTVLAPGAPDTEAAWQEALKSIRNADRQRTLYLDRDQRRLLLENVDAEIEPFVRTLCLLPLRPGAVAALTVGDFDKRTSELSIGKDKSGKPRRILVPPAAAELLAAQTHGRPFDKPLLARGNGKLWDKETWKRPFAKAVVIAKLPIGTTAYTLRHSTITDLVNGGLPLLSVAQISDTSAEMIERHYSHLSRHAAAEALAGLAL
ncbi:tyrosine-type recombinase/integrase [Sphingomonas qomolangmaensis]|uniref:Tyrosine-type recombinase/integrase n=1 Tax=Sphingomonas qomolangmaensis TaxID=2918765 RepID=A0ABY5L9G9_9SPHN|nr:tyrosine-type recombinase/integrase [Sphingomonas qomolangmaensis]UUL82364.1 tyrosine-type recombinase/integrase [Sphingomonas qomolangmaensis]